MAGNPNVVSGHRGAGQRVANAPTVNKPKDVKPGEMIFRSKASKYRVTITNPQEIFNPKTGRKDLTEKGKTAKFNNYILRTDDPETIAVIVGLKEYGLGRDIWLLDDEIQIQATEAVKTTIGQLHALADIDSIPAELRSKLVQALGGVVEPSFDPAKNSRVPLTPISEK